MTATSPARRRRDFQGDPHSNVEERRSTASRKHRPTPLLPHPAGCRWVLIHQRALRGQAYRTVGWSCPDILQAPLREYCTRVGGESSTARARCTCESLAKAADAAIAEVLC
eukprot:5706420-Prymnesium_polylepis.1